MQSPGLTEAANFIELSSILLFPRSIVCSWLTFISFLGQFVLYATNQFVSPCFLFLNLLIFGMAAMPILCIGQLLDWFNLPRVNLVFNLESAKVLYLVVLYLIRVVIWSMLQDVTVPKLCVLIYRRTMKSCHICIK